MTGEEDAGSGRSAPATPGRRAGQRRQPASKAPGGLDRFLGEPRNAVLILLGAVLIVGGGRKIRQSLRARRAVGLLERPDVTPGAVEASAEHGRAALLELFRLLAEGKTEGVRDAAGHALSVLWARDEMIAEEEKAVVRRGYRVDWKARRRYPRGLRSEIPFVVDFGVPFLRSEGAGVRPSDLEWSYRVVGARRASLETFSPWTPGPCRAEFTVIPSDFDTDGPHKLVFQARVRSVGLTDAWEFDLPHVPFQFEFDPRVDVASLLAQFDESRGEAFARSVRLVKGSSEEGTDRSAFLPLNAALAVRDVPALEVTTPLPCDLAHAVEIEVSGVPGWHPAGEVVVTGQGGGGTRPAGGTLRVPLRPVESAAFNELDRPGARAIRARLVADPDRGWSYPDVRSVWPGTVVTDWCDVDVVRR